MVQRWRKNLLASSTTRTEYPVHRGNKWCVVRLYGEEETM